MGGINGSAHTQAWSSYGEVHETVGTVCEYSVEESGITETIAAVYQSQEACTGTPYLRTDTQAWSFYGEVHETVGTMCQDNKGKSGMRQKLSRVCTVGLHLKRHGFVLGFRFRF